VRISVRHDGPISCPHCRSERLRLKDRRNRHPRHESWGSRHLVLTLESRKFRCKDCGKTFWQRFPGILPRKRSTEPFRRSIYQKHWDGISRSRLGRREGIGSATVERWFGDFLKRADAERRGAVCPRILGIDEHFFSRRHGYATTFCDLRGHKVFDVVLGRSEAALESYLAKLPGKDQVRVVCMDLSSTYRALVRKHFPQARIVADRFHVIRLINHHFLACWRDIDPTGAKNRGLLSLMRRHRHNLKPQQKCKLQAYFGQIPALRPIYLFKQRLCYLLLKKHRTRKQCIIVAGIAGVAVVEAVVIGDGAAEGGEREIAQRVGLDEAADLFDAVVGGDQFALERGIDAVEAGRNGGRAGDAQVDLARAGAAHHADDLAARWCRGRWSHRRG
jgi:transposase